MRDIKKQIYLRFDEWILMLALTVGSFGFGEILLAFVQRFARQDENDIFQVGTVLALMVPAFLIIFTGISAVGLCFNMGISMCDTRKKLIPMTFAVTYLECLMITGTAYLCHRLELWIFRTFYSQMKNDVDLGFLFQWKYILSACTVIVAVQALFGTLFLKYGRIAFWLIWALWMMVCLGGPRLAEMITKGQGQNSFVMKAIRGVFHIFQGFTEKGLLAGLTAAAAVLIGISYFMLRKQQVTI